MDPWCSRDGWRMREESQGSTGNFWKFLHLGGADAFTGVKIINQIVYFKYVIPIQCMSITAQ